MIEIKNQILRKRFELLKLVREFFWQNNFIEVETPMIAASPGMEPNLTPIETIISDECGKNFKAGLITSPEYAMKKLVASGLKNIFQICKCFRNNESFGGLHNPEFTMLEWYRSESDYFNTMKDVEKMTLFLLKNSLGRNKKLKIKNKKYCLTYQNQKINLAPPWERISVCETFKKYTGINLQKNLNKKLLGTAAKKKGYCINKNDTFSDIFFKIFLTEIEPNLGRKKPTFVYDYPIQMAALSKPKKSDKNFAERFELYIAGIEIANAFSELTDAKEQLKRLKNEAKERKKLNKTIFPIDYDFIGAVKEMPNCAGIALGLDRLFMILLNCPKIEDILPFPATKLFKKPI